MVISLLADQPRLGRGLIPGLLEHWREISPHETWESREQRFAAHLNRDILPIAWVAHQGDEVMGTAALRATDLPGREDLTPWLGGVFVRREFRRQGIASALCATVEQNARALGFERLYLFTIDRRPFYERLGWQAMEPARWLGRDSDLMVKSLRAPSL